jgi:hypothetical protein
LVEFNDDYVGGGLYHSRIARTINISGTWRVLANSFSANVFAPYTLSLVCLGGPTPTPTPTVTPTPSPPQEIPTLSLPVLLVFALALGSAAIAMLRKP